MNTSRVGMEPFPPELADATDEWIDIVGLHDTCRINGFSGLALARLDVLAGLDTIQPCVAYRLPNGQVVDDLPMQTAMPHAAELIYESMRGWDQPMDSSCALQELPANARAYCERVAELFKYPFIRSR